MPKLLISAVVVAVFACAVIQPVAHADTIFNVSGTNSIDTITGTVSINTVTGVIDSGTLQIQEYLFVNEPLQGIDQYEYLTYGAGGTPIQQGSSSLYTEAQFTSYQGDLVELGFDTPSLVGYLGGPLCSYPNDVCSYASVGTPNAFLTTFFSPGLSDPYPYPVTFTTTSGTVTLASPVVSTTPEPSSLALLGSGFIGIAGLVRRRLISVIRPSRS